MRKFLLLSAALLFPFFVLAQNEPPVYKNFSKEIRGIYHSYKLNDHTNVVQIVLNDESFELVAIDDKMQVLWRTSLKGFAAGLGVLHGQIFATASSAYSDSKGLISPYTCFLVDGKTGKVIFQKVIYESKGETQEIAGIYSDEDASNITFIIRQTGTSQSSSPFKKNKYDETKDLTLVNLNNKLETIVLKPKIPDGTFLNMIYNNKGDLFIVTGQKDKTIKVVRYEAGKTEPSAPIIQDIDLHSASDIENQPFHLYASKTDRNTIYLALVHKNPDRDNELTVGKIDFNSHAGQITNEVFNSSHIKSIEKSYVAFDKEFDKPDIGGSKFGVNIRHFEEYNGTLLVTLSDQFYTTVGNGISQVFERAFVINGYDLNLKQKFQQLLPVEYNYDFPITPGYYIANNSLYIVTNSNIHGFKLTPIMAQLDLNTGNWVKIQKLAINKGRVTDHNVFWFKDSFIVPYMKLVGRFPPKEDIDLQLNLY
jgi:hypothetical protein